MTTREFTLIEASNGGWVIETRGDVTRHGETLAALSDAAAMIEWLTRHLDRDAKRAEYDRKAAEPHLAGALGPRP